MNDVWQDSPYYLKNLITLFHDYQVPEVLSTFCALQKNRKLQFYRKCPILHTKMPFSVTGMKFTRSSITQSLSLCRLCNMCWITHKQTRQCVHTGQSVLASTTRGSEITGRTVTFFTWFAQSQDQFQTTSKK